MRKGTIFWGVIIILIGAVLLVNNFVKVDIGRLIWPLLMIVLGVWVLWGVFAGPRSFETEEASIPLEGVQQARVRIRHGAGRLQVAAGAGSGTLASGTFGGGLKQRVTRQGDTLEVEMRVRTGGPIFASPWMWGPGRTLDWSVDLNSDVPLSLDVESGASDTRLDLTDLQVTDLRVQTGASSTSIKMPAGAGHTTVNVGAGAASVSICVPEGVAARIQVKSGLVGISVDKRRFPRVGGVYQSEDYDTATNRADIRIETGVGSVDVR